MLTTTAKNEAAEMTELADLMEELAEAMIYAKAMGDDFLEPGDVRRLLDLFERCKKYEQKGGEPWMNEFREQMRASLRHLH